MAKKTTKHANKMGTDDEKYFLRRTKNLAVTHAVSGKKIDLMRLLEGWRRQGYIVKHYTDRLVAGSMPDLKVSSSSRRAAVCVQVRKMTFYLACRDLERAAKELKKREIRYDTLSLDGDVHSVHKRWSFDEVKTHRDQFPYLY